jgi:hypothetical protein
MLQGVFSINLNPNKRPQTNEFFFVGISIKVITFFKHLVAGRDRGEGGRNLN